MSVATEVTLKALLCALAIAAVLRRHRWPGALAAQPERAGGLLAATAAVALMAWANFGVFHGNRFAHRWEQFHYFLGAKYFPELGYDGLYVASMGAQMQLRGGAELAQPFLRDLRTNEVRPTAELGDHGLEVRRRFSDARWDDFVRDDAYFLNAGDYEYLRLIRLDHGYNPSPAWTAVARLFAAHASASDATLALLGTLDLGLLAALGVALARSFGGRAAALAAIVFGLGYAWRWDWVGGGFLRHDWLAALGFALCAAATRRFATAGACLAYAALVRVFPLGFLLGPLVLAARDLRRGGDLRWARRFAAGFALAAFLGGGAGALAGRGARAWAEFAANTAKHERSWLTNNVGAKLTLLYGPATYGRRLVDGSRADAFAPWEAAMRARQHARWPLLALLAAGLIALAARAAWTATLAESLVLGVVPVFALAAPTGYYWAMLAFVPLRGPLRRSGATAVALLAVSGLLFLLHRTTDVFERLYGGLSWMLLGLAVAWLWPGGAAAAPPAAQKAAPRSRRR